VASDTTSLFRPEAIAARRDAWLGRPRLLQPLSVVVATALSVAVIGLILGFLAFGTYTRRVQVHGTVVPSAGVSRLFSPQGGRIVEGLATEGAVVRRGDVLYTIGMDPITSLGETEAIVSDRLRAQRAGLQSAIREREVLDAADKKGLHAQQSNASNELQRIDRQIGHAGEYVAALKGQAERYRELADQGIVVLREYEVRQQSYMQTRQELENLQRQRIQLQGRLADIHAKLAAFDANAAVATGELHQRIAGIDQQLVQGEARRAIKVQAPRDGVVSAILVQPGQMVVAGAPLLSILPAEGPLEIHLMASSQAIGFVREGVHVLLRYAAFPFQKFGQYPGQVTRVTRVTLQSGESAATSEAKGTQPPGAPYRITVRPDSPQVMAYGQPQPLRIGMEVEASLLLDSRKLYQWILEPLYSMRGDVSGPAAHLP
jgi:membrane fusion protein